MTELKIINLDMDGTFVDLYGVNGWLDYLLNKDTTPYEIAEPLVNFSALARVLNNKQRKGYTINVISWTAKVDDDDFNARVVTAKLNYLTKRLPSVHFDNIFIVPYGTPKHELAQGYLFDDEEPNRKAWGEGAYNVDNLIEKIKKIA
jgi:hypothetical protein